MDASLGTLGVNYCLVTRDYVVRLAAHAVDSALCVRQQARWFGRRNSLNGNGKRVDTH